MSAKSEFKCPACEQPLSVSHEDGKVLLWCGNGRCNSVPADDGAYGLSESEAFRELEKKIKDW